MNAKSLALAIALVASTGFVSSVQASDIVTLDTVQVRPTVGQIVELMAEQTASQLASASPVAIGTRAGQWMVSLPAITVRPEVEQVQAMAAEAAAEAIGKVVAQGMVSN